MELEAEVGSLLVCDDVDVRLLSYSNLVSDCVDGVPLGHGLDGEEVVPSVCQPVSVVWRRRRRGGRCELVSFPALLLAASTRVAQYLDTERASDDHLHLTFCTLAMRFLFAS